MREHPDNAPLEKLAETLKLASASALQVQPMLMRPGALRKPTSTSGGGLVFHGGMEDLSRFHTTLVRGGML